MTRSDCGGFSLVELMIVVVIIGLLATIAVPNYVAMANRAREASVKNNAHTLRLGVEDRSVTNGGTYPTFAELDAAFFAGVRLPDNPFTGGATTIAPLGYSRGNLGYQLVAGEYTIEGYGSEVTSGPLQDGVVILLRN